MKKRLLILYAIIAFGRISFGQPFGANNASWYFSLYSVLPPYSNSPIHVTSSAPFIFNGDTCRTISISGGPGMGVGCWIDSSYIVKESNDSVYYWLPTSSQFVMLYNYNAMVGDTQTIYGMDISSGDTSIQLVVTSAGTININGFTKKTYTTNYANFPHYFYFGFQVIEDIGSTFFLFPQWGFCDPVITAIRCYEDSVIGLFNFPPNIPCDTTIWLGIDNIEAERNITVFPNPFTSVISITFHDQQIKQATYFIKSILGQTIIRSQENNLNNTFTKEIDLNFLSKGMYLLEVDVDGERAIKKIIKN